VYDARRCSGERPDQISGRYHPIYFKPIHEPATDELHRSVCPEESRQQDAKLRGRNVQLVFQERGCNREIATVNVIIIRAQTASRTSAGAKAPNLRDSSIAAAIAVRDNAEES